MKKLLVVLSLAISAFSYQASAGTLAWQDQTSEQYQVSSSEHNSASTPTGGLSADASFKIKTGGYIGDLWSYSNDSIENVIVNVYSTSIADDFLVSVQLWDETFNWFGDLTEVENNHWQMLASLSANTLNYIYLFGGNDSAFNDSALGDHGYTISIEPQIAQTPIPAAIWLFGSAFMGLAGVSRRKLAKA